MLIECPECGKKISDKSLNCIFCGYPLSEVIKEELKSIPKDTELFDSSEKKTEYNCKINRINCNIKWLIDMLGICSSEEIEDIKMASKHFMNNCQEVRLNYNTELMKTEHGQKIILKQGDIVDNIRDNLNLSQEVANQFLYEILDNKSVPKEFNGLSQSEWTQQQIQERKCSEVYCKYCGSTNVKKLKYNFYNLGKEWHCNNCDSDF